MGKNLQDEIERAQARVKALKKKQREEEKRERERIGEILLERLKSERPDAFQQLWDRAAELRDIEKRDRSEFARMMASARYDREAAETSNEPHAQAVHE